MPKARVRRVRPPGRLSLGHLVMPWLRDRGPPGQRSLVVPGVHRRPPSNRSLASRRICAGPPSNRSLASRRICAGPPSSRSLASARIRAGPPGHRTMPKARVCRFRPPGRLRFGHLVSPRLSHRGPRGRHSLVVPGVGHAGPRGGGRPAILRVGRRRYLAIPRVSRRGCLSVPRISRPWRLPVPRTGRRWCLPVARIGRRGCLAILPVAERGQRVAGVGHGGPAGRRRLVMPRVGCSGPTVVRVCRGVPVNLGGPSAPGFPGRGPTGLRGGWPVPGIRRHGAAMPGVGRRCPVRRGAT